MIRKPMLAASVRKDKGESLSQITFPQIASGKYDGIRCVNHDGVPLSRSLKPIPNRHITSLLTDKRLVNLDGELMTGGNGQPFDTGPIMRGEGQPDFRFYVFDDFTNPINPYVHRVRAYRERVTELASEMPWLIAVKTQVVESEADLAAFTELCLAEGLEGAMIRSANGCYKFGRSTFKEQLLTKVKPMEDAEATVVGFEEQMENTNERKINELGRSKRSSHKSGKVSKLTLGALILHNEEFGEFRCGTGMDDALRLKIWNDMPTYFGETVTFRFQRIGMKDKPRIPSFKTFRHDNDMSS
jgi:DNA ligase-1